MTIQQLNYVITISEAGSLNKAAEMLYMAQPSLTSAVRELEKELGITLFNRSGRGVTLTNDGAEFIRYARDVAGQYERLLEKYGRNGNLKKKFGISTQHYTFAVKCFVELAKEEIGLRCDLHPLRVEVLQGDTRRLDDDVVVVHGLKIACAKMLHSLHLVFVGHRNDGLGQVFLQETQRRLALATEAEDQDALTT